MISRNNIIGLLLSVSLLTAMPAIAIPFAITCRLTTLAINPIRPGQKSINEIRYYFPNSFSQPKLLTMLRQDLENDCITIKQAADTEGIWYEVTNPISDPGNELIIFKWHKKFEELQVAQKLVLSLFDTTVPYDTAAAAHSLLSDLCRSPNCPSDTPNKISHFMHHVNPTSLLNSNLIQHTIAHYLTDYTDNYMHTDAPRLNNPHIYGDDSTFNSTFIADVVKQTQEAWLRVINKVMAADDLIDKTSNNYAALDWLLKDTRFLFLMTEGEDFKQRVRTLFKTTAALSPQHRARLIEAVKAKKSKNEISLEIIGKTAVLDDLMSSLGASENQSHAHCFSDYMLSPKIIATMIIGITIACGLAAWLLLHKKSDPAQEEK